MKINLAAPISTLGYGVHGTNLAIALSEVADVTLFPIGRIDPPSHLGPKLADLFYMNRTDWGPADHSIRLSHEFDQGVYPLGKTKWAYTVWEADKLSPAVLHQLNLVGKLIVPSSWQSMNAIENGYKGDVLVVPEGVDTDLFEPIPSAPSPKKKVVFVHFGKAELRKNTELIALAFAKEFREDADKVELKMYIHNPFLPQGIMDEAEAQLAKLSPSIKILPYLPSQLHVAAHLNAAHVAVFASRAEGWNLPLLEAMACGLQTVTTDNTGMSEFVTKENSFVVDSGSLVPANDGVFFRGDRGNWYDPPMSSLCTQLRNVYEHVVDTDGAYNTAGRETAKQFTWKRAAEVMVAGLEVFTGKDN